MGTTADKLNKVLDTKQNIKEAILGTGVSLADPNLFSSYASAISTNLVYPTQDVKITSTSQVDVKQAKTAQIQDANLVANNIRSTVKVLGIQGTLVVNKVYTGTSIPSTGLGQDGDIYIQTYDI